MELIGTIGILCAFWLIAWAGTSTLLSVGWRWLGQRIPAGHPFEREWALTGLATAPVTLATWIILCLIAPGALAVAFFGLDHCEQHSAHVHLCLLHPSAPLNSLTVGALLLCGVAAALAGRSTLRLIRATQPLRALRSLESSTLSRETALIKSDRPFALTYGLAAPRALISTALLDALSPAQRKTVFAHESVHMRRRDPLRHLIAQMSSVLVWPSVRAEILGELLLSTEQVCDEKTADLIGDRLQVADTILAVERLLGGHPGAPQLALGIDGGSLTARVSNLLDGKPHRRWRVGWVLAAVLGVWIAAAPALHHEAEHALDIVLRIF